MRRGCFMEGGEWTEMVWETHAFTKAIPFYGDGTNCKPNKRVTRNMGGRTWDGFFRTVLLDAEDGVNSAACLQVSLATLGFPLPSSSLKPPALHTSLLSYYSPSPSLRSHSPPLLTTRPYPPVSLSYTRPISPQKSHLATWVGRRIVSR